MITDIATAADTNILDEPVWGAEAIGKIIGRNRRVAYYLLEKGMLPARQIGSRWVSTRRKLLAYLASGEVAA